VKKAKKSGRIATALECAIPDWVYEKIEEEIQVGK
jgi:hypothetical protein